MRERDPNEAGRGAVSLRDGNQREPDSEERGDPCESDLKEHPALEAEVERSLRSVQEGDALLVEELGRSKGSNRRQAGHRCGKEGVERTLGSRLEPLKLLAGGEVELEDEVVRGGKNPEASR